SREHHIDLGPGGAVVVAGGKYTTHRKMAEEIVDFTLEHWEGGVPVGIGRSKTKTPVNPATLPKAIEGARKEAASKSLHVPATLYERYGAYAIDIAEMDREHPSTIEDPPGFPMLLAQL